MWLQIKWTWVWHEDIKGDNANGFPHDPIRTEKVTFLLDLIDGNVHQYISNIFTQEKEKNPTNEYIIRKNNNAIDIKI